MGLLPVEATPPVADGRALLASQFERVVGAQDGSVFLPVLQVLGGKAEPVLHVKHLAFACIVVSRKEVQRVAVNERSRYNHAEPYSSIAPEGYSTANCIGGRGRDQEYALSAKNHSCL